MTRDLRLPGHPDGHCLGLEFDGMIVAWGEGGYGQCSIPTPNADFAAVAAGGWHSPSPDAEFVTVAAGYYQSLGIRRRASAVPTESPKEPL